MWRLALAPLLVVGVAMIAACTQRVTRDDVTAARHNLDQQQQELRDAQEAASDNVRREVREAEDARHEALKPPGTLDPLVKPDPAAEERDVIDARRDAADRIRAEARDVEDARRDLEQKETKFLSEEQRREMQRDADRLMADADRVIADLKTRSNNAPEDGALKTKIADLQTRRDRVENAMSALNSATDANRVVAQDEAAAAIADLGRELARGQ